MDFGDDADSHGNYESSIYGERPWPRRACLDLDPGTIYPLANSHGNAYRESSSHSEYSKLYLEMSARKEMEDRRHREEGDYSIANSHGDHSPVSIPGRSCGGRLETDCMMLWHPKTDPNYEIANSHSNYRVFYDSQRQNQSVQPPAWPTGSWQDDLEKKYASTAGDGAKTEKKSGSETGKSPLSKKLEKESGDTTCDIEQCLVQIEESLMNIEQNLLQVQDLDLPELRNLLYKSPSIERSLYEMQDLLYAESLVPVIKRSKSLSLESDEDDDEEEEEEEEEEEAWMGEKLTIKDDDDENGDANSFPFAGSNEESSDTANRDENNPSRSMDDPTNNDWVEDNNTGPQNESVECNISVEQSKAVNFVPNSLGKTPSRRTVLDENKENIRLCWSEPEDPTVDYNLNNPCSEKKLHCRDKCHSRTNSLDENPSFKSTELIDKHSKTSLQNIFLEQKINRSLKSTDKAKSDGTLQTRRDRSSSSGRDDGKRNKERRKRRSSNENQVINSDDKNEDFRRKIESMVSHRRSTISSVDHHKKPMKKSTERIERERSRSSDRSPAKPKKSVSMEKINEKDLVDGKGFGCEKKKRKKGSGRSQSSSENALVPSKLISLSLSLLLAALLQAVRCLTDLVEDAFRSVSYDRNGLLQ